MKLTNVLSLPEPLCKAVGADTYSRGDADISVTGLIGPPRIAALQLKHWDELEEDVSDRIWSLVGQIGHGILERANENDLAEVRLFMEMDGWRLSGQVDNFVLKDGILTDYKFVTVWKVVDGAPSDWVIQTNAYATLLRANGYAVNKLQVCAILRDWSIRESRRREEYPKRQVVVLDIPIWEDSVAREYISQRIALHKKARAGDLPLCTSEERWERPPKYALMKKGRTTAIKLEDSEDAILQYALSKGLAFIESQGDGDPGPHATIHLKRDHFIQQRDAEQTRCLDYCPVAQFCTWWTEHPDNPERALSGLFS